MDKANKARSLLKFQDLTQVFLLHPTKTLTITKANHLVFIGAEGFEERQEIAKQIVYKLGQQSETREDGWSTGIII